MGKLIHYDGNIIKNCTFKPITEKWKTMTVDCFAYYKSQKYFILFHVSFQASSRLYWSTLAWQASYWHAIKQPASSKKAAKRNQKEKNDYFIFSLLIKTEDSPTLSSDLASDFHDIKSLVQKISVRGQAVQ